MSFILRLTKMCLSVGTVNVTSPSLCVLHEMCACLLAICYCLLDNNVITVSGK